MQYLYIHEVHNMERASENRKKRWRETMDYLQFGVNRETKDRLDKFKAEQKKEIIESRKKKRHFVTNTDVIEYLLDLAEEENT